MIGGLLHVDDAVVLDAEIRATKDNDVRVSVVGDELHRAAKCSDATVRACARAERDVLGADRVVVREDLSAVSLRQEDAASRDDVVSRVAGVGDGLQRRSNSGRWIVEDREVHRIDVWL